MATGEETMMNGTVNPVPLVNPMPLVLGAGGSVYGAPGPQEGDATLVPSSQAGQADGDVIGGEEESVPSPVEGGGVPPRRQAGPVTTGDSSPEGGLPLTKVELGSSVNNENGTSSTAESGTTKQTTSMRFTGQEHMDRIGESIEAQEAKVAELEGRMRLPDMQSLVDEKYRARLSALEKTGTLPPKGPERERVLRRLHRKAAREAEREYEAARDIRNKWLDPDYEPDKEYERQQNILSVISALGDLGAMAGRAVTAANSGIILPFESLSSGRTKDRKQSDKERQALKAGLEQLAQARREKEEAKLTDLEKSRLDLLKNPNLYEREVSGSTSRNAETRTSKKGTTGATERTYGSDKGGSGTTDPWKNARKNGNAVDIGLSLKEDGSSNGSRTMNLALAQALYNNTFEKIINAEDSIGRKLLSPSGTPYEMPKLEDVLKSVSGSDAEANARRGDLIRTNLATAMTTLRNNLYRTDLSKEQKDKIRSLIAQYDRDADDYSRMSMDSYDPYRNAAGYGTSASDDDLL